MRALLVCAAPSLDMESAVAREARNSDLVVAVDGGAGLCLRAQVTPDVIVGDFDSVDSATLGTLDSACVELVRHSPDKTLTDLDLALDLARNRGAVSVTVCAAMSGRVDHTLAALGSMLRAADLLPTFVEPAQQGWILAAEHRAALDIETVGATFSVIALGDTTAVSISGARWPLVRKRLMPLSSLGVSNRVADARARVVVHSGAALVVSPEISAHISAF